MARREFHLPDIGEGLAEAEIVQWLVRPGDRVAEDQAIVVVLTDKATVEVPSPWNGEVLEIGVEEGQRISVGGLLLIVDAEGDEPAAAPRSDPSPMAEPPEPGAGTRSEPSHHEIGSQASPAVRKLARDIGVNLSDVHGSGPAGRITSHDVEAHAARSASPPNAQAAARTGDAASSPRDQIQTAYPEDAERILLRGIRRRMAETMAQSAREVPVVTAFQEFDATQLASLLKRLKDETERAGFRFRIDALLVRAAVIALRKHPLFNAVFDQSAGEVVVIKHRNIGVAMATPQGLVVPVLQNADRLDLMAIGRELDRLVAAGRVGRLAPTDLRGGTFTLTNSGAWNGWLGTSLVRQPETAILGVGRIQDRAVVHNGHVVIRPMLPVSVNFDHRVIDGEEGMLFCQTLRETIESAESALPH